jgi:hypothetical protein
VVADRLDEGFDLCLKRGGIAFHEKIEWAGTQKNNLNVDFEYKLLYTQAAIFLIYRTRITDNLAKSNGCKSYLPS